MDCKYFETCSAPICPRNAASLKNSVWYGDEEVCRVENAPLVKRQRKIAKLGLGINDGCFTAAMLERTCVVGRGMRGIPPEDYPFDEPVKKWLNAHPEIVKREFSPEQRKTFADRLKKTQSAGKMAARTGHPSMV